MSFVPTILDDLGLLSALKFLAEGVAARTGLLITVEGDSELSLPPLLSTTLYRIVQEGFTNVTDMPRRLRWMSPFSTNSRLFGAPSRTMESALMCHPSQHEPANEALV